jgi:penicillin-binding protein 1C
MNRSRRLQDSELPVRKARFPGKIAWKCLAFSAVCFVSAVILAFFYACLFLPDYGCVIDQQSSESGAIISDRNGRTLRLFPDALGRFSMWTSFDQFPESLIDAVLAAEDRRFFSHFGIDPLAVTRSIIINVKSFRIVSGASTITQQVVRLIHPKPRTWAVKFREMIESMKLERQLSKEQILELYLNLAPMGGNIRGFALASNLYFGKDISMLTPAQGATLAALPRSPSTLDPGKLSDTSRLMEARNNILQRMSCMGSLTQPELVFWEATPLLVGKKPLPSVAPHFTAHLMKKSATLKGHLKTTLDVQLQRRLESILSSHRKRLAGFGVRQAAAVVVSAKECELLAMVGSFSYAHPDLGYNNGATSLRSAGSTLKPFLYALALDEGYLTNAEIPDTKRNYRTEKGDYLPVNADRISYGPVNIRLALGGSLNIPAVRVLNKVGTNQFFSFLGELGLTRTARQEAGYYGLGLAIGNLEVSLLQLVEAYSCLARMGEFRPITFVSGVYETSKKVISPGTAYVISHILADHSAKLLTFGNPYQFDFGFPVSLKTGTSTNFRDGWLVAYTSEHIIGMWVGNFNGSGVSGTSGATSCGPILHDIIQALYGDRHPKPFDKPDSVQQVPVCSLSGLIASRRCPYASLELLPKDHGLPECNEEHYNHYRFLGGNYAQWIHRREMEQGLSRYRLKSPTDLDYPNSAFPVSSHAESTVSSRLERPRIHIVSPHDRDRYVMGSGIRTKIMMRAVPEPVAEYVTWLVDGKEIEKTPPPYEFSWEPERGEHVVVAVTPNWDADKITIRIED